MMAIKVLLCLTLSLVTTEGCIMLLNGWKPLGIEKRAELADVVVSTKALSKSKLPGYKWLYAADFEVLSILKGWSTLESLKRRKSNTLESKDRLKITVSGFGDRRHCFSSVDIGERYILFLAHNNVSDSLVAKYDDIFGAAELLHESSEDEILLSLGWRAWTPWSACSHNCGGGLRLRQRQCIDKSICAGPSEEIRECNLFPCQGTYNILEFTKSFDKETGVNNAVINNAHDAVADDHVPAVPTYLVFPDGFPLSFSLFATIKVGEVKEPQYFFSSFDANNRIQFGVRLEKDCLYIVYTNPQDVFGEKLSKAFPVELKQTAWQEIAISLEEKLLRVVVNCNLVGEVQLAWSLTDKFDIFGFLYVGADKSEGRAYRFKHEISQLMISRDPGMLWKQCGTRVFFYPGYLGKARQQAPAPSRIPLTPLGGDDSESGDVDENVIVSSADGESTESGEAPCFPSCKNNGVCKDGTCICQKGWTGIDCSDGNTCLQPCLNGGVCKNKSCLCKSGWSGKNCGTPLCTMPCQNSGICLRPGVCACKNGTEGRFCEKFICKPACKNGGECVAQNTCQCPPKLRGRFCERDICGGVMCLNGGSCHLGKCLCPNNFHGSSCQHRACKVYGTRRQSYLRPTVLAELKQYKYQCGILLLRTCSSARMVYKVVQRLGFRDEYYCKE